MQFWERRKKKPEKNCGGISKGNMAFHVSSFRSQNHATSAVLHTKPASYFFLYFYVSSLLPSFLGTYYFRSAGIRKTGRDGKQRERLQRLDLRIALNLIPLFPGGARCKETRTTTRNETTKDLTSLPPSPPFPGGKIAW